MGVRTARDQASGSSRSTIPDVDREALVEETQGDGASHNPSA
jgi:hypothetical protein